MTYLVVSPTADLSTRKRLEAPRPPLDYVSIPNTDVLDWRLLRISELPCEFLCLLVQVLVVDLFATGGTGGEREVDEDGGGDVGLVHNHRAGLDDGAAQAEGLGQVVVLGALALGEVQAPVDTDAGVAGDALLDATGGLLGADEDDAQGAATLGDVEQDVLDRAVTFARGVLVELVQDDEDVGLTALGLLLRHQHLEGAAHDELLGHGLELADVHHGDAVLVELEAVRVGVVHVAADHTLHGVGRHAQAAQEGQLGALVVEGGEPAAGRRALALLALVLGLRRSHDVGLQDGDEVV